jgi:hypothetical protein
VTLDDIYVISDKNSDRFKDLQNELDYLARFVISNDNIHYIYEYNSSNVDETLYKKYATLPTDRTVCLGWDKHNKIIPKDLSLCLNHLHCLSLIKNNNKNYWSLICEDDIFVENKEVFNDQFNQMMSNIPQDADIVWISSGKKHLQCTYRNVCGEDSHTNLIAVNENFIKVPRSRYTDCILLRSQVAELLEQKFLEYKIGVPIDWEYNYILHKNPNIKSYWLSPAIIRQNPKYL